MDQPPPVAIGHVRLHCRDVASSKAFYEALGMRDCSPPIDHLAILELRGGTHLLLIQSPDEMMELLDQPFDLMVDDLAGFATTLDARGIKTSEQTDHVIAGHRRFWITDPDGRQIAVHSSHTEGRLV